MYLLLEHPVEGSGNIEIELVAGNLFIADAVSADGWGNVRLAAEMGQITISALVTSETGSIAILAQTAQQDHDLATSSYGDVSIVTDGGDIIMVSGTVSTVGKGDIDYITSGNVALSQLHSTSGGDIDVTAGAGDDVVTGAISDNLASEDSNVSTTGTVSLNAKTGVGGVDDQDIDVDAGFLAAENLVSGNIYITEIENVMVADPGIYNPVGDVILNAGGDITASSITADNLVVVAAGSMDLTTTVDTIDAQTTLIGDITIHEFDDVTLTRVTAAEGSITVEAGGSLTALAITGDALIAVAAGAMDLTTTVDTIDAQTTSTGDIMIVESDDVTLTHVTAADGSITVETGGSLTALSITGDALIAVAAGAMDLTTTVDTIDAQTTSTGDITIVESDDVTLTRVTAAEGTITVETGGSLTALSITGDALTAVASGAMDLTTTVDTIDAQTTSTGDITITESDAVTLTHVTVADGSIIIEAGGSLTAVALTGDALFAVAAGSMDLTTTVDVMDVQTTSAGELTIRESDSVIVTNVTAVDGSITVEAGGDIEVQDQGGILAMGSGSVTLDAAADVNVVGSITTVSGNILLTVDNDIRAAASGAITTTSGTLVLVADDDNDTSGAIEYAGLIDHGSGGTTISRSGRNAVISGMISGSGGLTMNDEGILILSGANTYTGVTNVNAGTLQVDGSTAPESAIMVGDGTALSGNGVVGGEVTFSGVSHLTPGPDVALLTAESAITFINTTVFDVELNGLSSYDALQITAPEMNLDTATLNIDLNFTPEPGTTFVIIDVLNSGDSVNGIFDGLSEGTKFVADSGVQFIITYLGGDGNDVVLTTAADPADADTLVTLDDNGYLVITDIGDPAGDTDDLLTIQSDTTHGLFIISDLNQVVVFTDIAGAFYPNNYTVKVPFDAVTGGDIVFDLLVGNDYLVVDFSLGDYDKAIVFNAGEGGDSLMLTGGGLFAEATFDYLNETDGTIQVDGNAQINYTSVEPALEADISVTDLTLNYSANAETITVASADTGQVTVDSTAGVETLFNNPASMVINAGDTGDDIINIEGLNADFTGNLILNDQGGVDTVNFQTTATNMSGNLMVTADVVNFNTGVTSLNGSIDIISYGDINVFSGGFLVSDGDINLLAGGDVLIEDASSVQGDLKQISIPILTTEGIPITTVTGYQSVLDGVIDASEVTWMSTTVTELVGYEKVLVGYYETMDVTLVQTGFYNPLAEETEAFRSFFIEGVDYYNNTDAPEGLTPDVPVIDWGVLDSVTSDYQAAEYKDFTQLSDEQRQLVVETLGYLSLYDLSYTNPQAYQVVDGVSTVTPWMPDWNISDEPYSDWSSWNTLAVENLVTLEFVDDLFDLGHTETLTSFVSPKNPDVEFSFSDGDWFPDSSDDYYFSDDFKTYPGWSQEGYFYYDSTNEWIEVVATTTTVKDGVMVCDTPIATDTGFVAEFSYYFNGDYDDYGFTFFLTDGETQEVTIGDPSSELSYSGNATGGEGVPNAYMAVGFDSYGIFDSGLSNPDSIITDGDSVIIAGSGDGDRSDGDYRYLTHYDVDGISKNLYGAWYDVRITFTADEQVTVEMSWDGKARWVPLIDNFDVGNADGQAVLPETVKFGFTTSVRETNLYVDDLQVTAITTDEVLLDETFVNPWSYNGTASHSQANYIVLTDNSGTDEGLAIYNTPISTASGFITEFEYYAEYDGTDYYGLTFFLVDGETTDVTVNSTGGYTQGYAGTSSSDGIPNAYMGIGFDYNGTFDNVLSDAASIGDHSVVVAGSGDGDNSDGDYRYIAHYDVNANIGEKVGEEDGVLYNVRVIFTADAHVTVMMSWDDGTTWHTVIDNVDVGNAEGQVDLPETVKFGFAASSSSTAHRVDDVSVMPLIHTHVSTSTADGWTDLTIIPEMGATGSANMADLADFLTTNGFEADQGRYWNALDTSQIGFNIDTDDQLYFRIKPNDTLVWSDWALIGTVNSDAATALVDVGFLEEGYSSDPVFLPEAPGEVEVSFSDTDGFNSTDGYYIHDDFAADSGNWSYDGYGFYNSSGYITLTDDNPDTQSGLAVYNTPISTDTGFIAEFSYYACKDGADNYGITFFLTDGETEEVTVGHGYGSLGYAGYNDTDDGIPNAYLGVGFDLYSDFADYLYGGPMDPLENSVVVAGSGNGDQTDGDYQYITRYGVHDNLGMQVGEDAVWYDVRIIFTADEHLTVMMSWDEGTTWHTVIDHLDVGNVDGQADLPDTVKFGFSSASSDTNHYIDDVKIMPLVNVRARTSSSDAWSAWTPLFHDVGEIGAAEMLDLALFLETNGFVELNGVYTSPADISVMEFNESADGNLYFRIQSAELTWSDWISMGTMPTNYGVHYVIPETLEPEIEFSLGSADELDPPDGYLFYDDFDTYEGWSLNDKFYNDGANELIEVVSSSTTTYGGLAVYDTPIATDAGFTAEFEYYFGGTYDDYGFTFFLTDAANPDITAGVNGTPLSYSGTSSGEGLSNAYMAVAFDIQGSLDSYLSNSVSTTADSVIVVGSGDGTTEDGDYRYLTHFDVDTISKNLYDVWNDVRITFTADAHITVEMSWDDKATWVTLIDDFDVGNAEGQAALPDMVKFGFSAAVRYSTFYLDDIKVTSIAPEEVLVDEDFANPWSYDGTAKFHSSRYIELTDSSGSDTGLAVYNTPISTENGFIADFYFYNGGSDYGTTFFLVDGETTDVTVGDSGYELGYAGTATVSGIPNAYLGIGLDQYGYFATVLTDGPSSALSNSVTIAGSGNGDNTDGDYRYIGRYDGSDYIDTATLARVILTPDARLTVMLSDDGSESWYTVVEDLDIGGAEGQAALPETVKFGFSASGSSDYHYVFNVRVMPLVQMRTRMSPTDEWSDWTSFMHDDTGFGTYSNKGSGSGAMAQLASLLAANGFTESDGIYSLTEMSDVDFSVADDGSVYFRMQSTDLTWSDWIFLGESVHADMETFLTDLGFKKPEYTYASPLPVDEYLVPDVADQDTAPVQQRLMDQETGEWGEWTDYGDHNTAEFRQNLRAAGYRLADADNIIYYTSALSSDAYLLTDVDGQQAGSVWYREFTEGTGVWSDWTYLDDFDIMDYQGELLDLGYEATGAGYYYTSPEWQTQQQYIVVYAEDSSEDSVFVQTRDREASLYSIYNIEVVGWDDKYIRMPTGAHEDVAEVIAQGDPATTDVWVGEYREHARVSYTQDSPTLETVSVTNKSYATKASELGVDNQSTISYTYIIDNGDPERWYVDYLSDGSREYSIDDGRSASDLTNPDANGESMILVRAPEWVASLIREGDTTQIEEMIADINGVYVNAPEGFLDNSAYLYNSVEVLAQELGDPYYNYEVSGSWVLYKNVCYNTLKKNIDPEPGVDFNFISFSKDGAFHHYEYTFDGTLLLDYQAKRTGILQKYDVKSYRWADSSYWEASTAYDDQYDYTYDWTSEWYSIFDQRDALNYEWTSQIDYVYEMWEVFEDYDYETKSEQDKTISLWKTIAQTEDQTFEGVALNDEFDALPYGGFDGATIEAGGALNIQAGGTVNMTGQINAEGSVSVDAENNLTLEGVLPEDATDPDTLPAVTEVTSATGDITLNADANLTMDWVELTAAAGRIDLTSGADATITNSLVTALTDITATAGSEILTSSSLLIADGASGAISLNAVNGDILLSDTYLEATNSVTANAPAGSATLSMVVTDTIAGRTETGFDAVGTFTDVDVETSGIGDITLNTDAAVTLTNLSAADGAINVTAVNDMTATSVVTLGEGESNDIILTTLVNTFTGNSANLDVNVINAAGDGDVILNIQGAITQSGGAITADHLSVTASDGVVVTPTVNTLSVETTDIADVAITGSGTAALELTAVNIMDGSLVVDHAGGDVILTDVVLSTNNDDNDLTVTAGGDIQIGYVQAGIYAETTDDVPAAEGGAEEGITSHSDVVLSAGGAVIELNSDDQIDLIADTLTISAQTGVSDLEVALNEILDITTVAGDIMLSEFDGEGEVAPGLTVTLVSTPDNVTLVAENSMTVEKAIGATISLESTLRNLEFIQPATGDAIEATSGIILSAANLIISYAFQGAPDWVEYRAGNTFDLDLSDITASTIILETGDTLSLDETLTATDLIELVSGINIFVNGTINVPETGMRIIANIVTFDPAAVVNVELNGPAQGNQIQITGSEIYLNDPTLNIHTNYVAELGDMFVLIDVVNAGESITGTFDGLPENTLMLLGDLAFTITYLSGDGNDTVFMSSTEPRWLTLDEAGNLMITDFDGAAGNTDDSLTIQSDTTNSVFIVSDPDHVVAPLGIAGAMRIDNHTVEIPFDAVTGGEIIFDLLAGNDSLIVDFSLGEYDKAIVFNAGEGEDSLTLTGGGLFAATTFDYVNETDGAIQIDGNALDYTNVESVLAADISVSELTLNYSTAAETITVVSADTGQVTVDSTVGVETLFNNPASMVINAGDTGDDTINIEGLNSDFTGRLTLDGQGGVDIVNFQTAAANIGDGLMVTADAVNFSVGVTVLNGSTDIISSGDINVLSGGFIVSDGDMNLLAGGDVFIQDASTVQDDLREVSIPILTTEGILITTVTGYQRLSDGVIEVSEVTWNPTIVTELVGNEEAQVGYYTSMDVTLVQIGFYSSSVEESETFRAFFIEGVNYYNNTDSPDGLTPDVPVIDWGALDSVTSDYQTAEYKDFAQLSDEQRQLVAETLGYLPLYDFSYANAQTYQVVDGSSTATPWNPDWDISDEPYAAWSAWDDVAVEELVTDDFSQYLLGAGYTSVAGEEIVYYTSAEQPEMEVSISSDAQMRIRTSPSSAWSAWLDMGVDDIAHLEQVLQATGFVESGGSYTHSDEMCQVEFLVTDLGAGVRFNGVDGGWSERVSMTAPIDFATILTDVGFLEIGEEAHGAMRYLSPLPEEAYLIFDPDDQETGTVLTRTGDPLTGEWSTWTDLGEQNTVDFTQSLTDLGCLVRGSAVLYESPDWEIRSAYLLVDTTGNTGPALTQTHSRDASLYSIYNIDVADWDDKYIRMPIGTHEDVLQVILKGESAANIPVGEYRDHARIYYTQDSPSLEIISTTESIYTSKFDEVMNNKTNVSYYSIIDDGNLVRWYVDYLSDGSREYSIDDGRSASDLTNPDINGESIIFIRLPEWVESSIREGENVDITDMVFDINSFNVNAPAGFADDSGQLYNAVEVLVQTVVTNEDYIIDGDWSSSFTLVYDGKLQKNIDTDVDLKEVIPDDGEYHFYEYTLSGSTLKEWSARATGVLNRYDAGYCTWNDSSYSETSDIYNNQYDYAYDWTSEWHSVFDQRNILSYQWVSQIDYETSEVFEDYEYVVKNEQDKTLSLWQMIAQTQDQTLEMVGLNDEFDFVPYGGFNGATIETGGVLNIQASGTISMTAQITAAGSVNVQADGNVTVEGVQPEDATDPDTLPAVTEVTSATGDITLNAGANLTMDWVDLTAAAGRIDLTSGADVTITNSLATALTDITTTAEGEILTSSSLFIADGVSGTISLDAVNGDILLSDTYLEATDSVTANAPTGSVTMAMVVTDTMSGRTETGFEATGTFTDVDVEVSGTGDITLSTDAAVTLTNLSVVHGSINVTAVGDITATSVVTLGGSDEDDITLTTCVNTSVGNSANLNLDGVNAAGEGDVTLDIQGAITQSSGAITADHLTVTVSDGLALTTVVNALSIQATDVGDVAIIDTGTAALELAVVNVMDGSLSVDHAGGDVILTDVVFSTNNDDNDMTVTAGGDIQVGYVKAGIYAETIGDVPAAEGGAEEGITSHSDIVLIAGGAIIELNSDDAIDLIADTLTLSAQTGVSDLEVALNEIVDITTVAGDITLSEFDGEGETTLGLMVTRVSTPDNVTLTAENSMTVEKAIGATVRLESTLENLELIQPASGDAIEAASSVILSADNLIISYAFLGAPDWVEYRAGNTFDFDLPDITAATIILETGATLSLDGNLTATDWLELASDNHIFVKGTINGPIAEMRITAGDSINIQTSGGLPVDHFQIRAAGYIFIELIDSLAVNGFIGGLEGSDPAGDDITLRSATGAIIDNTTEEEASMVTVGAVRLTAGTGIGEVDDLDIDITAGSLSAINKISGDIYISATEDLVVNLEGVYNDAGDVILRANNDIIADATGTISTPSGAVLLIADYDGNLEGTINYAGSIYHGSGGTTLIFAESDALITGGIHGSGGLTTNNANTLILSGTHTYTGVTNVNAGTLQVDGSMAESAIMVADGATLSGSGVMSGEVTLNGGSSLMPGPDAALLTMGGTVILNSATVFDVALNGGDVHDQIQITEAGISLNDTTLNINLNYVPTIGDIFVLINVVDEGESVSGIFNGLTEGTTITLSDVEFTMTYTGGDGNDVVLMSSTTEPRWLALDQDGNLLIIDFDGSAGNIEDLLTIQSDTENRVFIISDPDYSVAPLGIAGTTRPDNYTVKVPFDAVTGSQIIFDLFAGNDSLTIDFSLGDYDKAIVLNAGEGEDSLMLTGGGLFAAATFDYLNETDGSIQIDGNASIDYTSVEPILSPDILVTDLTLNYSTTAETITVVSTGIGQVTVDSTAGVETLFNNPASMVINAGDTGDDTINIEGLNTDFTGSLSVDGQGGEDTINVQTETLNIGGDLTVTTDTINVNAAVTTNGTIQIDGGVINLNAAVTSLNGAINIISGSAITVDGLTASGGAEGCDIIVTTTNDDIIVGEITVTGLGNIILNTLGPEVLEESVTQSMSAAESMMPELAPVLLMTTDEMGNQVIFATTQSMSLLPEISTGNIYITTVNAADGLVSVESEGDILVQNNGAGVVLSGLGSIRLAAKKDLTLEGAVTTGSGGITLEADGDVVASENAVITTDSGEVSMVADRDNSGSGAMNYAGRIENRIGRTSIVQRGGNGKISGTISGGGEVSIDGDGTLILSGTNTYTGQTTVNAGTLQVDGSTADESAVVIGDDGVLSGRGYIGGTVRHRGGRNVVALMLDDDRNLLIVDMGGGYGDTHDQFTIQCDITNGVFIISEPNQQLIPLRTIRPTRAHRSAFDPHTVEVPFKVVKGSQIIFDLLAGNDSLTIDFALGDFGKMIILNAGADQDSLILTSGGPFATATFDYLNEIDGSIQIDGNAAINYTSVEPVLISDISVQDLTLNYSATAETITMASAGTGEVTVDSTAALQTLFTNPTSMMTINAGNTGDDTINVQGLDTDFLAGLTITGQSGVDIVNIQASEASIGKNLTIAAETLSVDTAVVIGGAVLLDAGSINLNAQITSLNGAIDITSGSAITIDGLTTSGGTDDCDITVTTTNGDILIAQVTTAGLGDVTLDSAGAIIDDGNADTVITADVLTADAAGAITIDTTVVSADISTSAGGAIDINETDAIDLTDIDTQNGSITIDAGGQITATDVESLTGSDVNDITLTTTSGDIAITTVDARTAGDVTLTSAGTITAANITGNDLVAAAAGLMDLTTTVDTIEAQTSVAGKIEINETDAVTLANVITFDGLIDVTAGGTIAASNVVSSTDSDANDIALTTTSGDVSVATINAGASGNVTLTSAAAITDDGSVGTVITADLLTAAATEDMILGADVESIKAVSSAAGDITITTAGEVTLTDVTTADGAIEVIANGTITATAIQSLTDSDANDVRLTTTSGDIIIDTINTGVQGDVVLDSARSVDGNTGGLTADDLSITAQDTVALVIVPGRINTVSFSDNLIVSSQTSDSAGVLDFTVVSDTGNIEAVSANNITLKESTGSSSVTVTTVKEIENVVTKVLTEDSIDPADESSSAFEKIVVYDEGLDVEESEESDQREDETKGYIVKKTTSPRKRDVETWWFVDRTDDGTSDASQRTMPIAAFAGAHLLESVENLVTEAVITAQKVIDTENADHTDEVILQNGIFEVMVGIVGVTASLLLKSSAAAVSGSLIKKYNKQFLLYAGLIAIAIGLLKFFIQ